MAPKSSRSARPTAIAASAFCTLWVPGSGSSTRPRSCPRMRTPKRLPAGEAPIVAADGRALARALRVAGKIDPVFVDEIDAMAATIVAQAQPGDVVIAMGAGSIGNVPAQVVELLGGPA